MALALTEGRGTVGSALSNQRCLVSRDTAFTGDLQNAPAGLAGKADSEPRAVTWAAFPCTESGASKNLGIEALQKVGLPVVPQGGLHLNSSLLPCRPLTVTLCSSLVSHK